MKKYVKRLCAFVLALIMAVTSVPWTAAATEWSLPVSHELSSINNDYVTVSLNAESGRFSVLPSDFYAAAVNEKSFATFRINGSYFVFGQDVPGANTSLSPIITEDDVMTLQWTIYDYIIQQHFMIVEDTANENGFGVHIVYDILFTGEEESSLSMRLLLDTQLGAQEDAMIVLNENTAFLHEKAFGVIPSSTSPDALEITMSETFRDNDRTVPEFFRASTDTEGPWAYGVLSAGRDVQPPERLVFANFTNATQSLFDYSPDEQQALFPDSALLYFFPEKIFTSDMDTENRRVQFSTVYGFFGMENAANEDSSNIELEYVQTSQAVNHIWNSEAPPTSISSGDTVTIATGAGGTLEIPEDAAVTIISNGLVYNDKSMTINIPFDSTVTWKAELDFEARVGWMETGTAITLTGGGVFVFSSEGIILADEYNEVALHTEYVNIVIEGGTIAGGYWFGASITGLVVDIAVTVTGDLQMWGVLKVGMLLM